MEGKANEEAKYILYIKGETISYVNRLWNSVVLANFKVSTINFIKVDFFLGALGEGEKFIFLMYDSFQLNWVQL